MSWKPEVIADSSGKWTANQLRFATKEEAEPYVSNLMMRWTLVSDTRVVECDDPVSAVWDVATGKITLLPYTPVTPAEGNGT